MNVSFQGTTLPFSILLLIVLFYWLTVIAGLLDTDFMDVELDVDGDVELSLGESLLAFINVGDVPLMIIISILSIFLWSFSIVSNEVFHVSSSFVLGSVSLIGNLILSVLLTKYCTRPLVKVFRKLNKEAKPIDMLGKVCTLILPATQNQLGQAEVLDNHNTILVHVKAWKDETITKGERALIIEKDTTNQFYLIEKYMEEF